MIMIIIIIIIIIIISKWHVPLFLPREAKQWLRC